MPFLSNYRVLRATYSAEEFNAIRETLPQAMRRTVEPAPSGAIGLTVQAVSIDSDCTLMALYEHVAASADRAAALSELEARLRKALE